MATVLVTGCSTGIGFATALRLATEGFDVVATMRSPDKDGEPLLGAASGAGVEVRLRRLDVRDDESVRRAFEGLDDLEVLINNAGVAWFESAEEMSVQWWQDIYDTNLFGPVRCMRAALPILRARGGGCVVNVSSAAGSVAMPGAAAYGSSKAALESASEVVAIEGAQHGIRVVVVETGATMTAMGSKIEAPGRDSPYWPAVRNTMALLASRGDRNSAPDEIADRIARAVKDPSCPFRIAVGQAAPEIMGLRSRLSDEEWIALANRPSREFVAAIDSAEPAFAY
jgi:NAD(P)-dependent dehydrogenase (short-subunit alcohol dehydrogenase family)